MAPDLATTWGLVRRAVAFELGLYRSLYRWALRRGVPPDGGAEGFGYAGAVTPILWVFIILSAVEIPVFHVLLPWQTVRIILLVLGFWGLTWMVGLLASLRVHPHVLSDSGLRIRYGTSIDIAVPWEDVAEIRVRRRDLPSSRSVQIEQAPSGAVLQIGVSSQTNVDAALREPRAVPLPKGSSEPITELRFYADDPGALVGRARQHTTAGRGGAATRRVNKFTVGRLPPR